MKEIQISTTNLTLHMASGRNVESVCQLTQESNYDDRIASIVYTIKRRSIPRMCEF